MLSWHQTVFATLPPAEQVLGAGPTVTQDRRSLGRHRGHQIWGRKPFGHRKHLKKVLRILYAPQRLFGTILFYSLHCHPASRFRARAPPSPRIGFASDGTAGIRPGACGLQLPRGRSALAVLCVALFSRSRKRKHYVRGVGGILKYASRDRVLCLLLPQTSPETPRHLLRQVWRRLQPRETDLRAAGGVSLSQASGCQMMSDCVAPGAQVPRRWCLGLLDERSACVGSGVPGRCAEGPSAAGPARAPASRG